MFIDYIVVNPGTTNEANMNHNKFVEQLLVIPLEDSLYKKAGLDKKFIKSNKDRYCAVKRKAPYKVNINFHDPIISLIREYKVEKVEIGMINFSSKVFTSTDFMVFGVFEIDRLAISTKTKEVVMLPEDSDEIAMYCAKNGDKFLDSAIHIGTFLEKRGVDDDLYDDEKANAQIAAQCAKLAGGSKYLNFYRMMLGI